jgi:hypothetical protein
MEGNFPDQHGFSPYVIRVQIGEDGAKSLTLP